MASAQHPGLALSRAAGGSRWLGNAPAASRRGADFATARTRIVFVRRLPSQPESTCDLGRGDRSAGTAVFSLTASRGGTEGGERAFPAKHRVHDHFDAATMLADRPTIIGSLDI